MVYGSPSRGFACACIPYGCGSSGREADRKSGSPDGACEIGCRTCLFASQRRLHPFWKLQRDPGERMRTSSESSGLAWLAVGDAAFCFDPLSAQGLLNALYTGLAAAESADSYLSGRPEAVAEYAASLKGIHKAYTQQLAYWYGQERRWPEAPFWRRRH